jgi:hypothetical protein
MLHAGDVERVQALMRDEWLEAVQAEGTLQAALPVVAAVPGAEAASDSDDLTCPACGTKAPLVEGACSDCGLQLE